MQAVRVGEIATNLGDLLKQVQRGEVEDDLDNGRLKLAKAPRERAAKACRGSQEPATKSAGPAAGCTSVAASTNLAIP